MATFQQLTDATIGVSAHAWSPDGREVAFAPNSHELRIADATTLDIKHSLSEHDMLISAIDWHPTSNYIVTCAHDRNAFVWSYDAEEKKWKPSLVILRIERAALDCRWSLDGQKFAVASSAKCVPVCYYESDNNWWVSKMIKKHKSSVLSIAWHPCSTVLATGSSDFRCRIFSAHVDGVDGDQPAEAGGYPSKPFGEVLAEFTCGGWVHGVAYSPSGASLAFAGHDASISVVTNNVAQTLKLQCLPLLQLLFLDETQLVGAGHDANPALFAKVDAWAFARFIDEKKEAQEKATTGVAAKMAMWQAKDKTGSVNGASAGSTAWRKHQGPITNLKKSPTGFSTSALDGRLVAWSV